MSETDPFFVLHDGLPREGPGEAADVAWAAACAETPRGARILDAGCGPGGDIAALLVAAPEGSVLAVDAHAPFAAEAAARHAADPRVTARAGDMVAEPGPFDLIWCAGAAYFIGVTEALTRWRAALAPGGAVAFSHPCFFVADPSPEARAFWEGFPTGDLDDLRAQIRSAGYRSLGERRLADAAWEAYFDPMLRRMATLRAQADPELQDVLDEAEREASLWRRCRHETGYVLSVVRPE